MDFNSIKPNYYTFRILVKAITMAVKILPRLSQQHMKSGHDCITFTPIDIDI